VLDWAVDDEESVTVKREPFGTKVAWLESRIVTLWAPVAVGTPPAPTTISLLDGVRAVSTATSRDQPPLAATVVWTVGVPKISIALRWRPDVRTALPFWANVVTPGNDTNVGETGGSVPRRTACPVKFSGTR
jgi:hypothetical protein